MNDMGQSGVSLPPALGFLGSAAGTIGGLYAYAASPDTPTGTAGLYVGASGILLGSATLLGVLGDKWLPHIVQWARIRAENQEEYRKNREARHRLANEVQQVRSEMEHLKLDHDAESAALRKEAAEAREKADKSEEIAIRAEAELGAIKKYARERIPAVERGLRDNAKRLDAVEAQAQSGDDLPAAPPLDPRTPGTNP